MTDIKFEFGDDVKEYLNQKASKTLTLTLDEKLSEYARQCEVLSKTLAPGSNETEQYEKFNQDGIEIYLSKNANLDNVKTVKLNLKEYVSDRADRELIVELIRE